MTIRLSRSPVPTRNPLLNRAPMAAALLALSVGCRAPVRVAPAPVVVRQSSAQPAPADPNQWRTAVPVAGANAPWTYPTPQVAALSNRLAVYVLPRASGAVSLSLLIRHGGSDDPGNKSGLSSLAVRMIAEATKTKSHHVLSETVESLGSTLVADANRDYVRLGLDTLPDDVTRGIDLLAETLLTPAFDRDDFSRLKKQHLDDLVAERQVPGRLASLVGLRAVLGEKLGLPVGGRLSTIERLTLSDVRDWHRRFVYPEAVALVAVGPVSAEVVLGAAEKALGRLRGKPPKLDVLPQPPPPSASEIYVVDRPGSVQSALFVAQPFPDRQSPGYAARQLLDNVIGGQFTSRINQNLREKHAYTYGAHSSTIATRRFGLFTVATSVETNVTLPSIQEIVLELSAIRGPTPTTPIADEELTRARAGLIEHLGAHLEDGHRQLADLEQLFVHRLSPGFLNDYLTEVRSLPSASLVEQSMRLAPQQLSIVVVGDRSKVLDQLKGAQLTVKDVPADWLE